MKHIPYGRQRIDNEDIKAVVDVLKSDWITQGSKIKEFEEALCKYTGARYAVAVSSGTAALHLACLAAGIKRGDEVITSPITFVASANCVLYCGAKPVLGDIQRDTVNINPQEIKRLITVKTRAIIPVHFAGHPCDLREIHAIAKKHDLMVIEDAAHALGAEYRGSKIGSCQYSDMTIFSFHPVKHITTGEGGAILSNKKDLYEQLITLRSHGITKDKGKFLNPRSVLHNSGEWYYEMQELGFNYRITDFQCALGMSQFKKIDGFVEKRREIAGVYDRALCKIDEIVLPQERPYVNSSYHIYVVRIKEPLQRKEIFNKLRQKGIGVQVHYIPVYMHPYYKKILRCTLSNYPEAQEYYNEALTLPLYPAMKGEDIKFIINVLRNSI